MRVVEDLGGGADDHRDAQREIGGRDLERSEAWPLLGEADGGNHVRRPRRALCIDLAMPLGELRSQIRIVQKAALLEEGALHPADQILHGALLLRTRRPAHLNAESEIERDAGKERIPLCDLAIARPLHRDRSRSIEDRQQRNAAEAREVIHHRPHERFRALVRHDRHFDPPRVLQARGEEVHPSPRAVEKADVDLTEVVLGEFAGQALKPDQGPHGRRSDRCDQLVERRLPARVATQFHPPQNLNRQQVGLAG